MSASGRQPVPVTVVTGFLGSGKTTLVNRWLAGAPGGDIAVIVNEHGAIGVDGELLAGRGRMLVEIAGGCVCCSTQGELVRALDALASSVAPPRRVLVETSGAASPAWVLRAISGSARSGSHVLDGIVTVVDGTRPKVLAEHDLAVEQVGYADVLVLSRADLCEGEALGRAREACAAHNGAALVVTAARGAIDDPGLASLESLLDRRRSDFVSERAVPAARSHPVYESIALAIEGEVDGDRFVDFMETDLARFAGRLFRTKGILAIGGLPERLIVHGVADHVDVSLGEPWGDVARTSRLVVVGFGLDRNTLVQAFAACALC